MKKSAIILFLALQATASFSQSVNYFVDGSVWTYYTTESYEPGMCLTTNTMEVDSIQGDTLINAVAYKKLFVSKQDDIRLYSPCSVGGGLQSPTMEIKCLRYDSLSHKVFLYNDTGTIIPEFLLYDFNLQAGDTLPHGTYPWTPGYISIDSVNLITFFGFPAKEYYLPNYSLENYIIEGMGGSNGLIFFNPNEFVISGGFFRTSLQCFHSGDSLFGPSIGACPHLIPVGVQELKNTDKNIIVWPNPFTEQTSIKFVNEQTNSTLILTDAVGKVIRHTSFSGIELSIERGELPAGIYFVQISAANTTILLKKIVIL